MKYLVIPPPVQLKHFVKAFWVFEGHCDTHPYVYRSMADGCAELIFHYKGIFREPGETGPPFYAGLHAQNQQFKRFITTEPFGIFGAYLYPYAIPLLFGFSAHEATNQMPDLQTLLGQKGRELEDQIITAPDNSMRVHIITRFLEERLLPHCSHNEPVFSAIQYVIHSCEAINIRQLSSMFCMSERTLERRFKEYAGLSPKLLSRIIRFKAALNNYGNRHKTLTDIAYECGYYDQSHFINDFKAFSGYHPKQYFYGRPEGIEWREA
jgi:AraC-like DNA-binding protein